MYSCVCLLPFNIIMLRFTPVVSINKCIPSSLLSSILLYGYASLFRYSPMDGHFGCV